MTYAIKCKNCAFDTFARDKGLAEGIAVLHANDCINSTGRSDILILGGLHKFGHLGWVNLEWATNNIRRVMRKYNDEDIDADKAFEELDKLFAFPDEELKESEDWISDIELLNAVEKARK